MNVFVKSAIIQVAAIQIMKLKMFVVLKLFNFFSLISKYVYF